MKVYASFFKGSITFFTSLFLVSAFAPAYADQFEWHGSDPACKVQKLEDKQWKLVDAASLNVTPATIQKLTPPDGKSVSVRYFSEGTWFAATVPCFSNIKLDPKPAPQAKVASPQGRFFPYEIGVAFESRTETRPITTTTGTTSYDLTAKVYEFGVFAKTRKNILSGVYQWGALIGLGVGVADLNPATSAITYKVINQQETSGRFMGGIYRNLNRPFSFGLEAGIIYSMMTLPSPFTSSGLTTPKSGLMSTAIQAEGRYQYNNLFSAELNAGLTQFKNIKFGVGIIYRLR